MFTIVVLRLSSLGDVILITPVLTALKQTYPEAHLSVVVKSDYAPILDHHPHIDRVIAFDARGRHGGTAGLVRFIGEHRDQSWDLCIDLHANLRSRLISLGLKTGRILRYRKGHWRRWAMVHMKRPGAMPRHTVDLYCDALRPLGIEGGGRRPELYLTDDEIREARRVLEGIDPPVGIHVGAGGDTKLWPSDSFRAVVSDLQEQGVHVLLLGGDGDESRLEEITGGLPRKSLVMCGVPLRRLLALIDCCGVLLCHDSGPMHMAAARHVPVVALFGPTHPNLGFRPVGDEHTVLTVEADCSPCSLHGTAPCRLERRICLEEITPDLVTGAILETLKIRKESVDA